MKRNRRFLSLIPKGRRSHVALKAVNRRFDHEIFGLRPQHAIFGQHPTVNDELPHRIILGSIIAKPNVASFTKTGAVFDDGSQVTSLDAVIFCTGYKIGFKFLDKSILPVHDNTNMCFHQASKSQLLLCSAAFTLVELFFPCRSCKRAGQHKCFVGKRRFLQRVS